MTQLDELVTTLLYEGYALYPYTPGATKNATPTPFGIVYPPVYAAGGPTTFDRIRMQGIAEAVDGAKLSVEVRFLEPAGERHEGVERRVSLPPTPLSELTTAGVATEFAFERVQGRVSMSAQAFLDGITRISVDVDNTTEVSEGLDRSEALRSSLLSTHVIATVDGGRFHSPIAPPEHVATAVLTSACVNTYPVLATPEDDVLLGAAIILPDHPQIAPGEPRRPVRRDRDRGGAAAAPARAQRRRAHADRAAGPGGEGDAAARDPDDARGVPQAAREDHDQRPGARRADQELRGEESLVVDGITFRRGDHVRLRPRSNAATRRTTFSPAARRRSSASTSTTTTRCTCA